MTDEQTIDLEKTIFNTILKETHQFLTQKVMDSEFPEENKVIQHLTLCIAISAISLSTLTKNPLESIPIFMEGLKDFLNQYQDLKSN